MSHPIDTRLVMEKLTQSGVPSDRAKVHTQVLANSLEEQNATLMARICSKEDLDAALEPIHRSISELTVMMATTAARQDARIDTANAQLAAFTAQMMARFDATDAKIDGSVVRLDAKIDSAVTGLNAKIDSAVAGLNGKMDSAVAGLNGKIDSAVAGLDGTVESTAARLKGEWITWLLAFGLLQTALVGGFLLKVALDS